jgi:hypothetical protein
VKNIGGTFEHPGTKIVGHVGMNSRAFRGVVDHMTGALVVTCTLSTRGERRNCMTIEDLQKLATSPPEETTDDDDDGSTSSKKKRGKKPPEPQREEHKLSPCSSQHLSSKR